MASTITAERIRAARKAHGWVPYLVAYEQTGIKPDAWQNWETRGVEPSADALRRLSATLGVTTDWLLGVSDDGGPVDRAQATPSGPAPAEKTAEAADRTVRRGSRSSRRSSSSRRR